MFNIRKEAEEGSKLRTFLDPLYVGMGHRAWKPGWFKPTGDTQTDSVLFGTAAPVLSYGVLGAAVGYLTNRYNNQRLEEARKKATQAAVDGYMPEIGGTEGLKKVAFDAVRDWVMPTLPTLLSVTAFVAANKAMHKGLEASDKVDLEEQVNEKTRKLAANNQKELLNKYPELQKAASDESEKTWLERGRDALVKATKPYDVDRETGKPADGLSSLAGRTVIGASLGLLGLSAYGSMRYFDSKDEDKRKQKELEKMMSSRLVNLPSEVSIGVSEAKPSMPKMFIPQALPEGHVPLSQAISNKQAVQL